MGVQTFHDILLVLFKNTPGRNKVHRKEYELQDEFGDSLVEAQTWQRKALPGAVITMSVLLQLSSKSSESSRSCPRCRTVNHQPTSSRMIQWYVQYPRCLQINGGHELRNETAAFVKCGSKF
jgi:phage FluMu protein Com